MLASEAVALFRMVRRPPTIVFLVPLGIVLGICPVLALAPPQVSLPSQSALPGGTVVVPVLFAASGNLVSAVQFDLQYDSSAMSVIATLSDSASNANKNLYSANTNSGQTRFLIVGLNQNPLADGALISLSVSLNANISTGTYTLGLSNLASSDPTGSSLPVTAANGTLVVSTAASGTPPLTPQGVVNAASWIAGPVSPGEIVTLMGPGIGAPPSGQVSCPCSIWTSATTPGTAADPDGNAVEVGARFRSDVPGTVTGVRFYKGSSNIGTHIGHLWSGTGSPLANVTFSGETSSGWQQANFAAPVQIQANTTYIVSYYAPTGHYASDTGYFQAGVDAPPLHALADGVDGPNGVYVYGSSAFPNQTYKSSNYWVDVLFVPAANTPASIGVLFNNTQAPVLFAAQNQINTVAPYGLSASGNVSVQIQSQGQVTAQTTVPMSAAGPGLFTLDGTGTGQGAVLNQDLTVNSPSAPATRGTVVSLFGTGAGYLDPAGGVLQTILPVAVQLGGMASDVLYAGPAPGLVSGAIQINCRIPEGLPPSLAVPVSVQIGSFTSQAGVTIAVQ